MFQKLNPPYLYKMEVRPSITANTSLQVKCNGFILKNAGNTVVTIDGTFTLDPGQSLDLSGIFYDVIDQVIDLKFGTVNVVDASPVNNKVEYMEFHRSHEVDNICL